MAETAIIVSISIAMASGILKDVTMRSADALCKSSGIGGVILALFGSLKSDLRLLNRELAKLRALLRAERLKPAQCGKSGANNELVLPWLRDVHEAAYYADNVLDEMSYRTIRLLVESRSCFLRALASDLAFRLRVASKVNKFLSMARRINEEAGRIGIRQVEFLENEQLLPGGFEDVGAYVVASDMVGRLQDEESIVNKLCCDQDRQGLSVVAIVGMSGIGKTTLGRRVYCNKKVERHFPRKLWISVSNDFTRERVLNEMVESVTKNSSSLSNTGVIEDILCSNLKEKRLLLVFDGVWHVDAQMWTFMKDLLERVGGSVFPRVLITTQNREVASAMSASFVHELERLTKSDSWVLFEKEAFANKSPEQKSELKAVGKIVVRKCNGVPLAIKAMGSLLRYKDEKEEWEAIESSHVWGSDLGDIKEMVMPSLLLSFNSLPSETAKRCFAYCSVALPNGGSAAESMLVQLWMAQGFLQQSEQITMEDHGKQVVKVLLQRHLLQVDRYAVSEEATTLRMHDLMHNLALYISKGTSLVVKSVDQLGDPIYVKHLHIIEKNTHTDQLDRPRVPKLELRSLFSFSGMPESRSVIKFLRVLSLACGLTTVPAGIGRLKHLRYLDLSKNHFEALPDSIGDLGHLQTLKLEHCGSLIELPGHMTKLISLRHLSTTKHVTLPVGFGQLTDLQELPMLNLQAEGWKMDELGSLLKIGGVLSIKGLEHIKGEEDAKRSKLSLRPKISKLELIWKTERSEEGEYANDLAVLDGLQPHSNLKRLLLENYNYKTFPSWMPRFPSLNAVLLLNCRGCERLPTLGHLPSLQILRISGMMSLEDIGVDFYYSDKLYRGDVFPKLKELSVQKMRNLRHWSTPPMGSTMLAFPCLEVLDIKECPNLITAPTHFPSLQKLTVHKVELPPSVSIKLLHCTSLQEIKISSCKALSAFPETLQALQSLESFHVEDCDSVTSLPDITGLVSLTRLVIQKCKSLRHPPNGLDTCTSIKTLALSGCPSFEVFPNLAGLTRLEKLVLRGFSKQKVIPKYWSSSMPHLGSLDVGELDKELTVFPDIGSLPESLRSLYIVGWPKLRSLPRWLRELTQLERLALFRFDGLEALPEWVCEMSSLQILWIWECKNMRFLPQKDKMQCLGRLRVLDIKKCPLLGERCVMDGTEWDKIAHIRRILIDDEDIKKPA